MHRVHDLIARLGLRPHPEGGHYGERFRSRVTVRAAGRDETRSALTTIHFLLAAGERSRWHRVRGADEAWHFYEGEPLELLWVEEGALRRHRLGPVPSGASPGEASDGPVAVVPAGCWQAARPLGAYALVGCSVGPGFDFADFDLLADVPDERARLDALLGESRALV